MNYKTLLTILLISLILIIAGCVNQIINEDTETPSQNKCGDSLCDKRERVNPDLCPKDCVIDLQSEEEPVHFLINIHIEPAPYYCQNQEYFDDAVSILEKLMDYAEESGAKLSVFPEYTFLYGARNFQGSNNIIKRLISRGHSVGMHSHYMNFFKTRTDIDNECDGSKITKDNYLDNFEAIYSTVLGTDNIYSQIRSVYGAFGPQLLGNLKSKGIKATYYEICSFPQSSNKDNNYYVTTGDLINIPALEARTYLSSIYARGVSNDCYTPSYPNDMIPGEWRQEDFDLIYEGVMSAVNNPRMDDKIYATGFTAHLHNFANEDLMSPKPIPDKMRPDSVELEMFHLWLKEKIKPLEESGDLEFVNVNEVIEIVEDN